MEDQRRKTSKKGAVKQFFKRLFGSGTKQKSDKQDLERRDETTERKTTRDTLDRHVQAATFGCAVRPLSTDSGHDDEMSTGQQHCNNESDKESDIEPGQYLSAVESEPDSLPGAYHNPGMPTPQEVQMMSSVRRQGEQSEFTSLKDVSSLEKK